MGERSLIAFTLLVQAACGALVGLVGVALLGSSEVLGPVSFVLVGLLLLVAVIISTLHLGVPANAPHALRNWNRSWLSREVIGLGFMGALLALGAVVALLPDPAATAELRTLIAVLAVAAGAFLLLAMVRLYSVRTIPEWDMPTTAARFVGSTLRLGAVVAAILVAFLAAADDLAGAALAWLAVLLALGLVLEVAVHVRAGATSGSRAGALLVRGEPRPDHADARWLLIGALVAGVGLVALALSVPLLASLLLILGVLVLAAGEVRLRSRFYELAPRFGREAMRPASAPLQLSGRR